MNDHAQEFRLAIAAAGLKPPESIISDGRIQRYNLSGKPGDDAGWYIHHDAAGACGSWRDGTSMTWCATDFNDLHVLAGLHAGKRLGVPS